MYIVYCIRFCTVGTKLVAGMEHTRGPTHVTKEIESRKHSFQEFYFFTFSIAFL